jgi:ABC-type transport system involved in cytochrome c biogenesis permease subunit
MDDVLGGLGVLVVVYWSWAIARPAFDRPDIVRGFGAILLPVVAGVLMFLAWG